MPQQHVFECGCSFPIKDGKLQLNIREKFPDCKIVWDLIGSGDTKGIFQLESFLGQDYAKKSKPANIDELATLIAIIRPSCLQAFEEDGKSITDHYCMRLSGEEEVEFLCPELEPILRDTQGYIVFQEQNIKIATDIGKMSLQDADLYFRYAIGKKKFDLLDEGKPIFMRGCLESGLDEQMANQIFEWVRAAGRYQFNKSHAVSFAYHSYMTAYMKAHFTKQFFQVALSHAESRIDPHEEVAELVVNAKNYDITVKPPSLTSLNKHFKIIDNDIVCGLRDVKNIGERDYDKIIELYGATGMPDSWMMFLALWSTALNKSCVEGLICSGALDYFLLDRQLMLYEFKMYKAVPNRVKDYLSINYDAFSSLKQAIASVIEMGTGKDRPLYNKVSLNNAIKIFRALNKPPYKQESSPHWTEIMETKYIGASLTVNRLDGNLKLSNSISIKEFLSGAGSKNVTLGGIVKRIKYTNTKKGKPMVIFTLQDKTGEIDSLMGFDKFIENYEYDFVEDSVALLTGDRPYKRRSNDHVLFLNSMALI